VVVVVLLLRVVRSGYAYPTFNSLLLPLLLLLLLLPLLLSKQAASKWWEFRHEKFLRGKPHLLSQIRRATHGKETQDSKELE